MAVISTPLALERNASRSARFTPRSLQAEGGAKTAIAAAEPGRKYSHGSPSRGGDIARIFDYQSLLREKEAAAEFLATGVPSLWEDGALDRLTARLAGLATQKTQAAGVAIQG
ncbi:MAG: hypothetical protein ABR863_02890 [Roseiarcus sp.]|jgi:hypothetical protein